MSTFQLLGCPSSSQSLFQELLWGAYGEMQANILFLIPEWTELSSPVYTLIFGKPLCQTVLEQ